MDTDLRQTNGWAKYLQSQGWVVEEFKTGKVKIKVYIKRIPLIGSLIKIQRPKELPAFKKIDGLAKKYRAIFVKLEPISNLHYNLAVENGFFPDSSPNLPTKTIEVDLSKSEENLWSNLSQDTRQSIRKARNNRLTFSTYQIGNKGFNLALSNFHQLLSETGRRQRFWTPSLAQLQAKAGAFGKDVNLFLVYSKSRTPLAGAFILGHDGTHSASSKEGQRLYASYLLLWEVMLHLKKSKHTYQDLSGIYDPRFSKLTKRWQGFTAFKRKFGGKEVEYPRPLIKFYNPFFKLLFKFFKI